MKLLPPSTRPPDVVIQRRHDPPTSSGRRGYRTYRACLRWEFGFTCAFCLLHEADLSEHGAEGVGVTTIEHFVPVSVRPLSVNDYENCFYACRFCNESRSNAPVVDKLGRRLLHPCSHAWGDHFSVEDDRFEAHSEDAEYTLAAYDLNDPRKMECRRARRERLEEWFDLLEEGPDHVESLIDLCRELGSMEEKKRALRAAQTLRRTILNARRDVLRFAAIPRDADASCRCESDDHYSLPPAFEDQTIELRMSP